jgi:NAD(P)-dependent dehydrogenase (short-subunit alcohol dehydrogenase family)
MNMIIGTNLKDKVVVITGGAGGLGSSFSRIVASFGAKVVIIGRNEKKAQAYAKTLADEGHEAIGLSVDVTDKDALIRAHKIVLSTYGKTDILINCAGGNHPKATTTEEVFNPSHDGTRGFFDLDQGAFNDVYQLNFTGTLLPIQVFAQDMIGNTEASIINISSMSAYAPLTKIPAYSAAKAAINNFTQWLAVHFAKEHIRVNAIAPGFFLTEQNASLLKHENGEYTKRTEKILSQTPMGRFGEAEELTGTLLWLLDPRASGFVTGIVVPVDGGFSAFSGV